jgi:hypothetical protein
VHFFKALKIQRRTLLRIGVFLSASCLDHNQSQATCDPLGAGGKITNPELVYAGMPFSAGEEQHFDLFYMGVFVGYGKLDVKAPVLDGGTWSNVFGAAAHTAPSYEVIFRADEKMLAYSEGQTFAAKKFKMEQDEKQIFGDHFKGSKLIKFDHGKCYTKETVDRIDRERRVKRFELIPGSTDILSGFYEMRQKKYKIGKVEKSLVYTSEESWWAEFTPVSFEEVEVPAGKFNAVKLSLKTYIGKVAQQKGDMFMWIAVDHPSRPLVKVEGEVKVGSITLELRKFVPGERHQKLDKEFLKKPSPVINTEVINKIKKDLEGSKIQSGK